MSENEPIKLRARIEELERERDELDGQVHQLESNIAEAEVIGKYKYDVRYTMTVGTKRFIYGAY